MDTDKAKNVSYVEDTSIDVKTAVDGSDNAIVLETQDSRFATYMTTHKPHWRSKSLLALYPVLFVAFMNSAANGFDGNTFGGVSVCFLEL